MGEHVDASDRPAEPQPGGEPGPGPEGGMLDLSQPEAEQWAVGAHLSALIGLVGILPLIGPLVIYLLQKGKHPLVEAHAREALNFQLSLLLYGLALVAGAIVLVLTVIGVLLLPVVLFIGAALYLLGIIMPIVAAIKTSNGEDYRYPFNLRLIE